MTPVERLKAAIAKLAALRSQDVWSVYDDMGINAIRKTLGPSTGDRLVRAGRENGTTQPVGIDFSLVDAELIVTLHRTIDAQLNVLRAGLEWAHIPQSGEAKSARLLSAAILGEEVTA